MAKLDELNRLYNSKDPNDIIKFYDHFNTPEELIEWSRNRPRGRAKIYTVKGDTDIVVVIPTADRHGKYAKNCENIFEGQQIVFVESGGIGDPYFNYARNCNIGLKYALRYKPKWIVVSNDDMYKIDDVSVLRNQLKNMNNKKMVFTTKLVPNFKNYLVQPKVMTRMVLKLLGGKYKRIEQRLLKKFGVELIFRTERRKILNHLLYKFIRESKFCGTFFVVNGKYAVAIAGKLLDEAVLIDSDDGPMMLKFKDKDIGFINYKIGREIGRGGLTPGILRNLRAIEGLAYFNYLVKSGGKTRKT